MTGQRNSNQGDIFTAAKDLNVENPVDDLLELYDKKIQSDQFHDVIADSQFFGDISKHRQGTVFEIDVEIRLENYKPNWFHSSVKNNSSSKRRSSTTSMQSTLPTTSASSSTLPSKAVVVSGENDKQQSRYSSQTIARILHTKERMRRILYTPPESAVEANITMNENIQSPKSAKEKSPRITRLANHYFSTLGSRPKAKKPEFYSLPASSGIARHSFSPRSALTLKRAKSDATHQGTHLSYNPYADWMNMDLDTFEAKNESKLDNECSADSVAGFKKSLSRNKHQSLIQTSRSPIMLTKNDLNLNNNGNGISFVGYKDLSSTDCECDASNHPFSTLKRRFSKKSRSKSLSRKSASVEELLDVKHSESEVQFSPVAKPRLVPSPSLRKIIRKRNNKKAVPAENDDASAAKPQEKLFSQNPKQTRSIKDRFADFVAKRSPP